MVLGAGRTEGSAGNAFSNAAIESAGDVVAASSGRNASVTVNAASDGTVEGDFKFYGEDNAFRFTNDIRVAGDALVNAAAIHGTSLEAEGRLELIAALYDDGLPEGAPEGIAFTGNLSGTTAAVFTNAGDIRIGGRIEATEGYLDVYRLSTGASGVVAVNEAKGPYTITLYNGSGNVVVTGPVTCGDTVYAFAGWNGTTIGRGNLSSAIHKAGAVDHAENFSEEINLDALGALSAESLGSIVLPHLVFDEEALANADYDRVTQFVYSMIDTVSPSGEYFFLHLRPDAAASDADDEEEEKPALEEGLPGETEHRITDHRKAEPQTPESLADLGLLLSSR